jgi:hypothetical protein
MQAQYALKGTLFTFPEILYLGNQRDRSYRSKELPQKQQPFSGVRAQGYATSVAS